MNGKKLGIFVLVFLFAWSIYSGAAVIERLTRAEGFDDRHLPMLAQRFLQGELALSPLGLPRGDFVDFKARQFLYFGPFSSLVFLPAVYFLGDNIPQISLGIVSIALSLAAVYLLCRRLKFAKLDAIWLALFFCFSTVLFSVSVINISAFLVQSLGACLVLLALAEFFGKRRLWLVGTLIGLAGFTRISLYLSVMFFAFMILKDKEKVRKLLVFSLPVLVTVALFLTYNYKRFGDVWETGYKHNQTVKQYPMSVNYSHGVFSLVHVPANLYSLLVSGPEPLKADGGGFILRFPYLKSSEWGMAIWFTSPLFLYLFKTRRIFYTRPAVLTTLALAIPVLTYFGGGFSQFGYRYALDFMPFLFLLLLSAFRGGLNKYHKGLIVLGILINTIFSLSQWGSYPIFRVE